MTAVRDVIADSYQIVSYRPEFRDQLLRLQTHLWSPDLSLNDAYMSWKHEQNPYLPGPVIYVALHHSELVGMRGFFGTEWEAGPRSEVFRALYADDFVIAPEHRNRRLASLLMKTAFRELADRPEELAINLSAGAVTYLSSLATGWRSVGPMEPLTLPSRRTALLGPVRRMAARLPFGRISAQRALGAAAGEGQPFGRVDEVIEKRAGRFGPRVKVERTPRSDAMAELVQRLPSDGRLRHVRNERYLSWRFRNPLHDYRFFYWDGDCLEGYLVLQTRRAKLYPAGRVQLVDWEAANDGVRADLLRAALACGGFPELLAWGRTLSPAGRDLLREAGFAPADRSRTARGYPALLVRPLHQNRTLEGWSVSGLRLLDPASWDLRMMYSMHG